MHKNLKSTPKSLVKHLIRYHYRDRKVSPQKIFNIMSEFTKGFELLSKYKKAASIYGTSRCGFESDIYKEACQLSFSLAKDGFAIITGGGPGIMEAANKGALNAGGGSVGLNIRLKNKQQLNRYVKESEAFDYFFVRKTMLAFASEIYIFFPGGFGTLDEFFEMVMLVQTEKIKRIPIILINRDYWTPLLEWIKHYTYEKNHLVDRRDLEIYYLTDNADEAYNLIKTLDLLRNKKSTTN